jgi:hypothetical protein
MSCTESSLIEIAETWEEFDRRIEENAVVVEFASDSEERAYEAADWRLHLQICAVLGVESSPTRSDELVHVIEDWFPTRTKFVEADPSVVGPSEVESLRNLLRGEFDDWRINVQIFRGLSGPAHVGGINIYNSRILVQREVLQNVQRAA